MKWKINTILTTKSYPTLILGLLIFTVVFIGNLQAQDSKIWVKFNSSSDLPNCNGSTCTHTDQNFENYLSSLGVQKISIALPAIVNFPQASSYGLDLLYEIIVDSLVAESVVDSLINYSFIERARIKEEMGIPLYTPNDYNLLNPIHGPNWQLDLIDAENAWDLSQNANQIIIGINETGRIQGNHPDLDGIIENPATSGINYHKTHVAGCASAETNNSLGISSIGFNAKIYDGPNWENGLLVSASNGADIINVSYIWSCSPDSDTQNVINMLTDDGVIIVAGAGNGNIGNSCSDPNGYVYPASYDNVISVTSVGETNNHFWAAAGGQHTHNDKVDICTPGYAVLSTEQGGGYTRSSGTSMASPMTAGVIALLLNINPCLDHDDILSIIQSSADPVSDASNFPANSLGAGRINAHQACLAALQTTDIPNPVFSNNQTISNT
ncbi:S8 family serine peptidase [Cryomorpha ignava]|uniref:S8 family serine peptidase n=1 Tax=Cryomorpha ignava TaxID=101383 RepID=A0A7K3WMH3_9FLAO|nr:S8 family serine peptidase [Cryomorpha ignava]NEN22846.1 S8 family serine peptidase [Cryomorpha ignava]